MRDKSGPMFCALSKVTDKLFIQYQTFIGSTKFTVVDSEAIAPNEARELIFASIVLSRSRCV